MPRPDIAPRTEEALTQRLNPDVPVALGPEPPHPDDYVDSRPTRIVQEMWNDDTADFESLSVEEKVKRYILRFFHSSLPEEEKWVWAWLQVPPAARTERLEQLRKEMEKNQRSMLSYTATENEKAQAKCLNSRAFQEKSLIIVTEKFVTGLASIAPTASALEALQTFLKNK